MTPYTIYDSAGRILRSGVCQPETLDRQAGEGEFALAERSSDLTYYVLDGAVVPRPSMGIEVSATTVPADGVSEVTLSGVPAGALVRIAGPVKNEGQTEGGPITLTFAIPGVYEILLDLFPYQESKVTIHAI